MSTTGKALEKLREKLGRGGYKKVAEKVSCSSDWIGQVLRSADLAVRHPHVVDAAVEVIAEQNIIVEKLNSKVMEAVK